MSMSILIKGMKMPTKGGILCINIYPDGKVTHDLDLKCRKIATAFSVPLHGRLIDADAFYEVLDGGYDLDFGEVPETKRELLRMIIDAPTIIEAEEE